MKNAVIWDVAPCRHSINKRFGRTHRLLFQGRRLQTAATCSSWSFTRGFFLYIFFYPEDGVDTFLRNVVLYYVYTAQHSRKQHSWVDHTRLPIPNLTTIKKLFVTTEAPGGCIVLEGMTVVCSYFFVQGKIHRVIFDKKCININIWPALCGIRAMN
jgi:hypothetical protein